MEVAVSHDINITTLSKGLAKCGVSKACGTALNEDLCALPWYHRRRKGQERCVRSKETMCVWWGRRCGCSANRGDHGLLGGLNSITECLRVASKLHSTSTRRISYHWTAYLRLQWNGSCIISLCDRLRSYMRGCVGKVTYCVIHNVKLMANIMIVQG